MWMGLTASSEEADGLMLVVHHESGEDSEDLTIFSARS